MNLFLFAGGCGAGALPREAVTHNAEGARALAEGRLDDAEARFRLALEYEPRFSEPHANLGVVAMQRGRLVEAERHLRAAIELREDFAQAWGNLGLVLERRGDDEEAREAFERALSIDPGLVPPRWNLARMLVRRGRFVEARAHLMRLVQITDDPSAEGLLAYAEMRLDRRDAARQRAQRVLERAPDAGTARLVRGMLSALEGGLDEAVEDLRVATRDPEVGVQARTRLAAVHLLRGEREQAESLLDEVEAARPGDPAVAFLRARLAAAPATAP